MTEHQHRAEYMSSVKWTTALYIGVSTVSIVLAISGVYYGLRGDIKDSRTESKEQITAVATMLNRKIDSNQHINEMKFQQINLKLDQPLMTEKKENGRLIFVPVK